MILSTHILPEVEATCDRILIINKGKIAADGTVQQLRKQSEGKSLLQVRIDGAPAERIAEGLRLIEGLQKVMLVDTLNKRFEIESNSGEEVNRLVYRTCVQNHWDLLEMIPFETKLEDIFRDLTIN